MRVSFPIQRPEALKDWKSSASPEIVQRAKDILAENYNTFGDTANFIGVGASTTSMYRHRQCHAAMTSVAKEDRAVLATENACSRRGFSKEKYAPFLDWFINHSPFAFIILNRDDPESCEKYGFVLAGDAPSTYVQSACIISRHFYERSYGLDMFNTLVGRGIDPLIAFNIVFCSNAYSYFQEDAQKKDIFMSHSGHSAFPAFNPETLLNVVRGHAPNLDTLKTYLSHPSTKGTCKLFVDGSIDPYLYPHESRYSLETYRRKSPEFHNFMLEREGKLGKAEVYRPPNPFAVKPAGGPDDKSFTIYQALTDVADYMQQYMEKHLNG